MRVLGFTILIIFLIVFSIHRYITADERVIKKLSQAGYTNIKLTGNVYFRFDFCNKKARKIGFIAVDKNNQEKHGYVCDGFSFSKDIFEE